MWSFRKRRKRSSTDSVKKKERIINLSRKVGEAPSIGVIKIDREFYFWYRWFGQKGWLCDASGKSRWTEESYWIFFEKIIDSQRFLGLYPSGMSISCLGLTNTQNILGRQQFYCKEGPFNTQVYPEPRRLYLTPFQMDFSTKIIILWCHPSRKNSPPSRRIPCPDTDGRDRHQGYQRLFPTV